MLVRLLLVLSLIVTLTGCATTHRQPTLNQVQIRLGELERKIALKDEQVKDLKYEVKDLSYEIERMKEGARSKTISSKTRSRTSAKAVSLSKKDRNIVRVGVSIKSVQLALKNAGYYVADVDGKLGAKTKAAIGRFQKDHGLGVDGIVGKKTWQELKVYLE